MQDSLVIANILLNKKQQWGAKFHYQRAASKTQHIKFIPSNLKFDNLEKHITMCYWQPGVQILPT